MRLGDVSHSRAGDKGRFITLSLTPYDLSDYPRLREAVTAEFVADHLGWVFSGGVRRFEVDNLSSLHFVGIRDSSDSVTLSLAMDRHGKSLSGLLLDLPLLTPAPRPTSMHYQPSPDASPHSLGKG